MDAYDYEGHPDDCPCCTEEAARCPVHGLYYGSDCAECELEEVV